MVKRAIKAHQQYPNKRLIVHFMQPHYPFIHGDSADSDGLDLLRSKARGDDSENETDRDVWSRLAKGDFTHEEVWEGYHANLELVLQEVTTLISELDGFSVITSDHGNALGERAWPVPISVYGHPNGVDIDALREVPWYECEYETRRDITKDQQSIENSEVKSDIDDRLEALGYK